MRLLARPALLAALALVVGLVVPLAATPATADHTPLPSRVTLMGDLMSRARLPRRLGRGLRRDRPAAGRRRHRRSPGSSQVPAGQLRVQGAAQRHLGRELRRLGRHLRPRRQHPAAPASTRRGCGSATTTRPTEVGRGSGRRPRRRWAPADQALADDQPAQGPHRRALLLRDGRPVRERRRPANDKGGLDRRPAGHRASTRPSKGFYHGGDLKGLHRPARLHRGSRHHRDLADAVVQEQAGAGRRPAPSRPATTATGSPTSPRSTRTSAPTPTSRR